MYKAFYGLNDNPFSIAPNPHYLFLSGRHREALAHLTYGLGETGGFVLLTGEVGTGKTTVSRRLLNQLPDNTDTAFILNPSLTEQELLATVCDELGIIYTDNPSIKQLTDLISRFLLDNHQASRNTVLIIDEAQHLRPEVLEQLRLLTNLETDTKKLLQVILIGQPELQQLLKRQELRQLAQRITARYHLLPLTYDDVGFYILHRLQVAGRQQLLFNRGAIKALHQYSGGIPRLINLIAERALMAGFANSCSMIDAKMVKAASYEVSGEDEEQSSRLFPWIAGLVSLSIFSLAFYFFYVEKNHAVVVQQTPAAMALPLPLARGTSVDKVTPARLTKQDPSLDTPNMASSLLTLAIEQSRHLEPAYASLLQAWGKTPYIGLSGCQAAGMQALRCFQLQGSLVQLLKLNYPAVVYLVDDKQQVFYGTLLAKEGEQVLLQLNEQQLWVSQSWFNTHFSGTYEVFSEAASAPLVVDEQASLNQLQWLENSLALVSGRPPRLVSHFDNDLKNELKAFQLQHGLKSDGIAGSNTLSQLNLYLSTAGPRLENAGGRY
ncbi:ExeA family protein [Shewanella surugensis]|uniref:AAA family ATPase n=1 Tax=Shewanella surugensis TaxID=212020 RepID=A0ABT0L643_9GAMM|nr:AAA family ATPase [Shewanella surugensis]MCL1123148.1 AAA family ATPase [Shewanella surugensis]